MNENAEPRTYPNNSGLRALVIAMCEKHALSGQCGPDCICQELLDQVDPERAKHWKRCGYRKAANNGA